MLFIYYPKCSTCQKAKKWLDAHEVTYTAREIKEMPPTEAELTAWIEKSGRPVKSFFNTSGQVYRALQLKDKLPTLSEEAQIALLASDPMLVKRPLLIVAEDVVLSGFREKAWQEALGL